MPFWQKPRIRILIFELLLMLTIGIAFYLVLILGAKSSMTQQLLQREQTLARAEASNITSFFESFGDSVAVFARLNSTKGHNTNLVENMDAFVEQWRESGLVGGIAVTDSQGIVKFNSNVLKTRDVGASLSDRDYFLWAKNQTKEGEYIVGQATVSRLGSSKGQTIVVVASPIFQEDAFAGVVAASVKLEPLTKRYLELMKVSQYTDIYLIGYQGDLLYDDVNPNSIGTNIFKPSGGVVHPFLSSETLNRNIKNALETGKEGKLETQDRLTAYSQIVLNNRNWLLVMTSPARNVESFTTPIFARQTAILTFIFLGVLALGEIITRVQKKSPPQNKIE